MSHVDPESGVSYVFLSNNFTLAASTICKLYRCHWQVELFFKWIKQHLRIKAFFGTSKNAVKTQVWIALCTYLLVAILRKRLKVAMSMGEMLQILSVSLFEKTPLLQAFSRDQLKNVPAENHKQLSFLEF